MGEKGEVSPTSIRSRILKAGAGFFVDADEPSFTHVDPFEDTESPGAAAGQPGSRRFTHVDPFEDTESRRTGMTNSVDTQFHPRRSVRGY